MRIVATSDTHRPPFQRAYSLQDYSPMAPKIDRSILEESSLYMWHRPTVDVPDGDVFIHAGDAMRTGYPNEWYPLLNWFGDLQHKIKIFVPGNHDFHLQVYPGPALQQLREVGVNVVGLPGNERFSSYLLPNGWKLLGLPYVLNAPRWAFNSTEQELDSYLQRVAYHDIIVSHSPVYGILDKVKNISTGVRAYRAHAERLTPLVWVNGHIHEGYGETEEMGCRFYNVAMCDRDYAHVNSPAVIDV